MIFFTFDSKSLDQELNIKDFFLNLGNNEQVRKYLHELVEDSKKSYQLYEDKDFYHRELYFIPWFYIYDKFDSLFKDICQSLEKDKQTKKYFSQSQTLEKSLLRKNFLKYAHPETGNIFSIPLTKLTNRNEAWMNWFLKKNKLVDSLDRQGKIISAVVSKENLNKIKESYLDKATKMTKAINQEIAQYFTNIGLGKDRAYCYGSIKELARALHATSGSTLNRRIIKIYSLLLCSSEELLKQQREMIRKRYEELKQEILNFANDEDLIRKVQSEQEIQSIFSKRNKIDRDKEILDAYKKVKFLSVEGKERGGGQYFQYYKNNFFENINFKNLVNSYLEGETLETFNLPPVIVGAIIINDFRNILAGSESGRKIIAQKPEGYITVDKTNLFPDIKLSGHRERRYSLSALPAGEQKNEQESIIPNQPTQTKEMKERLQDVQYLAKRSAMAHEARMTTEAGPSGHMAGILTFWQDYHKNSSLIVACSMLALWTLYYDKRTTPVHTMLEVFEPLIGDKNLRSLPLLYSPDSDAIGELELKLNSAEEIPFGPVQIMQALETAFVTKFTKEEFFEKDMMKSIFDNFEKDMTSMFKINDKSGKVSEKKMIHMFKINDKSDKIEDTILMPEINNESGKVSGEDIILMNMVAEYLKDLTKSAIARQLLEEALSFKNSKLMIQFLRKETKYKIYQWDKIE